MRALVCVSSPLVLCFEFVEGHYIEDSDYNLSSDSDAPLSEMSV